MSWTKTEVDFGTSKFNETKEEVIKYLGEQNLSNSNFLTSCGCTSPTYNSDTKELKIGLRMNSIGVKTASVTVNYPNGNQTIIILKAQVL